MRVILCNTYEELSKNAAKLVASQICLKPNCVLGLATGATPIGMYEELVRLYNAGEIDFKDVVTFNLDEYYPISPDNPQSYHYFMNQHLCGRVNLAPENVHILNGETDDPETECDAFDALIESCDGIDLQILGIGRNGHIGFNEPDDALNTSTHITDLTESTIEANARFFDSIESVPKQALTMGIATILKSRKIILLANGKEKHDAVSQLLTEEIDTEVPATMVKVHPEVVLICDREAYGDGD